MQRRTPVLSGSILSAAVLFASVFGAGAVRGAEPPADGPIIHYFKEARPLSLDGARIAVFRSETPARKDQVARPALREALANAGVEDGAIKPMVIAGWTIIESPALRAADVAASRDTVARLAADPGIDFVSPVFVDDLGGPLIVTPDLLVGFEPGVTERQARELLARHAPGVDAEAGWGGMHGSYRVRPAVRSGWDVLDAANRLAADPLVRYAEPDMMFSGRSLLTPNDPLFGQCWGLNNTGQFAGTPGQDMNGPEAWDVTVGSPDIIDVIIDVGVQLDHPDLNLAPGIDVTSDGPGGAGGPVSGFDNHGTAVAGCVSALINNGLGTVGIAPACRSAPARTFIAINSSGNWNSSASWTVDSLNWAQSVGARVTNNSNGYGFTSSSIAAKYADTRAAGMVHFASAGNDGSTNIGYPASLSSVNAVAALAPSGDLASFSTRGPGLDFCAPGQNVESTDRQGGLGYSSGDYVLVNGTSFASPYCSGVAALVLSRNPFLSASDVELILQTTATEKGTPGYDETFGWGLVNARAALDATPLPGPPGDFTLFAPANGAANQSRLPSFSWQSSVAGSSYRLEVDDSSDFSSPVIDVTTGLTSYVYAGPPLAAATTYWWRVTAQNGIGSVVSTPSSFSFGTISVAPGSPTLLAPADAVIGVSATPSFSWSSATFAESYTLTIDDNADFSSPVTVFNSSLTSYFQGAPLLPMTVYYWTVQATNPIGSTASTPAVRSFQTIGAAPLPFNLLTPADGSNVNSRTPTLTWEPSFGAVSYRLILDDSPTLNTPVLDVPGIAVPSYQIPAGNLLNGGYYFWRIIASNVNGTATGSPPTQGFGVVIPPCQGDANGDGFVNFTDITSTLANFGGSGPPGDANHDGAVNFVDVTTVLATYGATCPG